MDEQRGLLVHFLAALAYRAQKALRYALPALPTRSGRSVRRV